MADHQFQPCSSWWTSAAAACLPDAVTLPAAPPFVGCSTVLARSLNYCEEMTSSSTTSPSASVCNSSVTFQDFPSAPAIPAPPMDHFHSPHDWNQLPFCFHGLLQEDAMNMDMNPLGNPLDISSIDQSSFASPYASPYALDLEQDGGSQSFFYGRRIQVPRQQLQFSGEALFWNNPTATEHHNSRPPPHPPRHQSSNSSYGSNNLLETPSTLGTKASMENRKNSSEPAPKRTRIETSSPLPTRFKVRKEKLGDRITALQQLVSPFGKTDTASVLHEAIDYINFLHDQVRVLSAPYLKNGHPVQQPIMNLEKSKECDEQNQDLRSRGLCLVPISSTFAVANEIPTDFWTPTFMGAFR